MIGHTSLDVLGNDKPMDDNPHDGRLPVQNQPGNVIETDEDEGNTKYHGRDQSQHRPSHPIVQDHPGIGRSEGDRGSDAEVAKCDAAIALLRKRFISTVFRRLLAHGTFRGKATDGRRSAPTISLRHTLPLRGPSCPSVVNCLSDRTIAASAPRPACTRASRRGTAQRKRPSAHAPCPATPSRPDRPSAPCRRRTARDRPIRPATSP